MRRLADYTFSEWARLRPFEHGFKQIRNDVALKRFVNTAAFETADFLRTTASLRGSNVLCVIAFEQPNVLGWLLFEAKRHVSDATIIVFDNSNSARARDAIRTVCQREHAPYLGLPPNHTGHINRHHGRAMTWVFYNVIRRLEPERFGFIDHDLIPVRPTHIGDLMRDQILYGFKNKGCFDRYWSLWAGFCLYRYRDVSRLPLNFLYDFSADLDTGGRNFPVIYQTLEESALRFSVQTEETVQLRSPSPSGGARSVAVIDNAWMHIGGISYNDNYRDRAGFFDEVERRLRAGHSWDSLLTPRR